MLLLKFFGGLLIVISGTLCGVYASHKLGNKVKFMEQYLMFLTHARTTVSYTAVPAEELLRESNAQPLLKPLLTDVADKLGNGSSFDNAWRSSFESKEADVLLSKEDRELVCGFGDAFGTSDINGEIEKIGLNFELVKSRLEQMRNELGSKRRIYRILGMFAGVVVTVLIC